MTRVRGALGPIAAVWLLCQAATLTLVLSLLGASLADCTCTHGADAACPMHHGAAATSRVCVMQSMTASGAATLGALCGVVGLAPVRPQATAFVPTASNVVFECSVPTERPSTPDPP